MKNKAERLALLLEMPRGSTADMVGLRKSLKALLRQFGLRCVAIKKPEETKTFSEPADSPSADSHPK